MRMASRPTQPGDVEMYDKCRSIILAELAPDGFARDDAANYARDYGKGARGDW